MGDLGFSQKAFSSALKSLAKDQERRVAYMDKAFSKGKRHHKPFPVEVNGCAMIEMHLDAVERGAILDLGLIRNNARLGRLYLEAIGRGELPKWHELTPCPGCGSREGGRDIYGLCDTCNAKNHVAGDGE